LLLVGAREVGSYLLDQLKSNFGSYDFIGDIRGLGLMVGIEVVRSKASKFPAPVMARWIKERMKERRVLLSTDGPYDNVVKIKPPMSWVKSDVQRLVSNLLETLEGFMTSVGARVEIEREEEKHLRASLSQVIKTYQENEERMYSCLDKEKPNSKL
jgi:ethanolamine-phosphate phospho-lyase